MVLAQASALTSPSDSDLLPLAVVPISAFYFPNFSFSRAPSAAPGKPLPLRLVVNCKTMPVLALVPWFEGPTLWAGHAGQRGPCMHCGLQIADCGLGRPRTPKGTCVCAGTGYKVTFVDNQGLTFTKPVTLRLQPVTFGYKCWLRASFWVSGSVLPVTLVTWLHLLIIKGLYFARRLHCGYNRLHFVAPRPAGSTQRFTEANEGNEEI